MPYRNGRPGVSARPSSTIEPAMQQRADRVVGVDAADPLDGGLRDRLAIGDDRERLERRPATGGRVGARRSARRARRPRARSRARRGRRRAASRMPRAAQRDLEVAEAGVDGRAVRRRRARRSRAATAAARRRTGAPRGRPRSARSAGGAVGVRARRLVGVESSGSRGDRRSSAARVSSSVTRTTPATSSSGVVRGRPRRRRPRPAPRRSSPGRRSGPTARPASRRSRGASSARASRGT